MEIIQGKRALSLDAFALAEKRKAYKQVWIDLGTGDGRYVQHMSQANPDTLVIGIDACRENLYKVSHRAPENTLFIIANALALPPELTGLAAHITVNFPWGSLIQGLLVQNSPVMTGLTHLIQTRATFEIHLNAGALEEAGWSLNEGTEQIQDVLMSNGFRIQEICNITSKELKTFPTTWAKRLAFGRNPYGVTIRGTRFA